MLPPRWRRLPCRNIEVRIVSQKGAWSAGPGTSSPGLVISYGIAPYS
jgi:hypothetical protein